MTTTAMPELPEPELGYIETDKSRQPAFSARQMRAAMQAQPAAVSDAEIDAVTLEQWGQDAIRAAHRQYARTILALRPQAVPMTEDAARLDWMASRSAHIGWDRDGDFCRVWAIEDEEIGQAPITGWHDSARDAIDAARGITAPAGGEKQA